MPRIDVTVYRYHCDACGCNEFTIYPGLTAAAADRLARADGWRQRRHDGRRSQWFCPAHRREPFAWSQLV